MLINSVQITCESHLSSLDFLIFDKISAGVVPEFGTLITFILYSNAFFNPLREMAELVTQVQSAIASWNRIHKILMMLSIYSFFFEIKN